MLLLNLIIHIIILYVEDNKHDRQLYEYKEKDIQEAIDLIRNNEKENNKKNSGPEIKM